LLSRVLAMPAGLVISPALLALDPAWDRIRDDPRFKALTQAPTKAVPGS
jgi:serine/threonine-protein kinase